MITISCPAFLLFLTFAFAIGFSSGIPTAKSETVEQGEDEPFLFPEIEDGNALEATMKLLRSQQRHHEKLRNLFSKISQKNKNRQDYEILERSCDGILEFADELLTNATKNVTKCVESSSVSDYCRREPINYQTSRELTDCWKHLDDFVSHYVDQLELDVNPEIGAVRKPLDSAIEEMESYSFYLDLVYEETKEHRLEIYFRYPKYGRTYHLGSTVTVCREERTDHAIFNNANYSDIIDGNDESTQ